MKEFPSLGTDIFVFHLTWQILVPFGCFYTLYDEVMYSIFIDLWDLVNKFNIQDISIFDNLFVEYRVWLILWSNCKKLEETMNELRKTCSEGIRMMLCYHCWVLVIIHYKHCCRIFRDEHLPSTVYFKSPEELIWALNNLLLIFSTY